MVGAPEISIYSNEGDRRYPSVAVVSRGQIDTVLLKVLGIDSLCGTRRSQSGCFYHPIHDGRGSLNYNSIPESAF